MGPSITPICIGPSIDGLSSAASPPRLADTQRPATATASRVAAPAHPARPACRLPTLPVGGRLRAFKVEWANVSNSPWVMKAVTGLPLALTETPPLTVKGLAYDSARGCGKDKRELIQKEVTALLQKRAIEKAPNSPGFFGRIFLVPKKSGGYRPVFNLKPLNAFIEKETFKMATIRTVKNAIRPGDFAISLDLKDAYLHIPMLKTHRKFLRFCFKGQAYQFTVLPFGLSSAPRTFTKLTRVIVIYCRRLGMRLILYLDDSLLLARPREKVMQHRDILVELLLRLGWIVNWDKSDMAPSQDWEFIGLLWSSRLMTVGLPQDKLAALQDSARIILDLPAAPTCRRIQRFLGKANFAAVAVPRARLHSRALQRALQQAYKSARDLFKPCPLSQQAKEELQWWLEPPVTATSLVPPLPSTTITSDASCKGWGAQWAARHLAGTWGPNHASAHINILEMRAVLLALKEWAPQLSGSVVAWYADNRTVVAYLLKEGGTRSWDLCALTKEIFKILDRWAISLRPAYLKGIANAGADSLSRGKEVLEWCLSPSTTRLLFRSWGKIQWDLFADNTNTKAPNYFTLDRHDSKAQGVDAFLQDWANLQGPLYAFPPPQLIPQVLAMVTLHKVRLVLIAPCWEDAAWLPELLSLSIRPPRKLPPASILQGPRGKPPPKHKDLRMVAWNVSGRDPAGQVQALKWLSSSSNLSSHHPRKPTPRHGKHGAPGVPADVWTQLNPL